MPHEESFQMDPMEDCVDSGSKPPPSSEAALDDAVIVASKMTTVFVFSELDKANMEDTGGGEEFHDEEKESFIPKLPPVAASPK